MHIFERQKYILQDIFERQEPGVEKHAQSDSSLDRVCSHMTMLMEQSRILTSK